MDVTQAITGRRSIRGFKPEPVSRETLRAVLSLATRAVSAVNAQPWEFSVVSGQVLEAIRQDNIASYDRDQPTDIPDITVDGIYKQRSREIGKALFAAMDIQRGDTARRRQWGQRGLRFFDAPAVIILCMDQALDNTTFRLDMGCVIQNICLAAIGVRPRHLRRATGSSLSADPAPSPSYPRKQAHRLRHSHRVSRLGLPGKPGGKHPCTH